MNQIFHGQIQEERFMETVNHVLMANHGVMFKDFILSMVKDVDAHAQINTDPLDFHIYTGHLKLVRLQI